METFPTLLALCEGNPSVTDGFPSQSNNNVELHFYTPVKLAQNRAYGGQN